MNVRHWVAWTDPLVRRRWRQVLSGSQMIGGLFGAILFSLQATHSARPAWHTTAALLFSAASLIAGWLLFRQKRGGTALSVAVQAVQTVWIWGPDASYRITSGLALLGGYTSDRGVEAIVGATVAFHVGLPESTAGVGIGAGINLFSIAALIALLQLHRTAGLEPHPADAPVDGSVSTQSASDALGAPAQRNGSSPGHADVSSREVVPSRGSVTDNA